MGVPCLPACLPTAISGGCSLAQTLMELVVNLICHKSSPCLHFHSLWLHSMRILCTGGVARKSRANGARHFALIGLGPIECSSSRWSRSGSRSNRIDPHTLEKQWIEIKMPHCSYIYVSSDCELWSWTVLIRFQISGELLRRFVSLMIARNNCSLFAPFSFACFRWLRVTSNLMLSDAVQSMWQ